MKCKVCESLLEYMKTDIEERRTSRTCSVLSSRNNLSSLNAILVMYCLEVLGCLFYSRGSSNADMKQGQKILQA